MLYRVPHFLNGQDYIDEKATRLPITNPALGEIIGQVEIAGEQLCQQAIEIGHSAFIQWSQVPAIKRARVLFKFRELVEKDQQHLAELITQEHGKTIEDAKGSIARALELIEWHCGLLGQLQGEFTPDAATGIDTHTFYQPLGICVGISPFNFPVMVPVWMLIPALACGNSFILKPSEQAPSAPHRLLELLSEAGLPAGVAQCIHGDKNTVQHLITHPKVAAVTAVASTQVARTIYQTATQLGKRAHTFGGAKNHCVVMPDACLNQTAKAIVGAAYGSAGERCMALSVVVAIGDEVADALIEQLIPEIEAIRVDKGDAAEVDMGPLISATHRLKVLSAIDQGVSQGAKLVIDGRKFIHPELPQGFFVGPTLFDKVQPNMELYQQEIFGPVLIVMRVHHFEEALQLVNTHQYGNGTAIFTQNGRIAREYSHRVQAGMVGINIPIPVPIASHPFGGWKQSAFGDTNMHGLESIHFYTKRKTITTRWLSEESLAKSFYMPTHQ